MTLNIYHHTFAQEYWWSGNGNNTDFFDETNWININNGQLPPFGTINPNQNIDYVLNLTCSVNSNAKIKFGSGSLVIEDGTLTATEIDGGIVTINSNGYLNLTSNTPLINNTLIKFTNPLSWMRCTGVSPQDFENLYTSQIYVNDIIATYPNTLRIDNYYSGSTIRPEDPSTNALQIFSQESLQGNEADILLYDVYEGVNIPNNMNNTIASFLLKKGYMVTFAVNDDGTGKSKVFIASESDLVVNNLPEILSDGISFIRVIPWNWVSKKGTGGYTNGPFNNTWFYLWGNGGESDIKKEYAPMSWGGGGTDPDDIESYKNKRKATHIMGFNEPDDCNGQSGQFGDLCIPEVAIEKYKNLMKTGLRMVSPSCREEAVNIDVGWLGAFNTLAVQEDVRIDVIAVHWYDWGSNPQNSPNEDPQLIFNRFVGYLNYVYNNYQLPIWITEFNGNPNRSTASNLGFMQLALPYLESLDYVERYAWFEPNSGTGEYFDTSGNFTDIGNLYNNTISTPTITENIWGDGNNLNSLNEGIESSINCTAYSTLSLEDYSNTYITIYPNPSKDVIVIKTFITIEKVDIYDLSGRLHNTIDFTDTINISNLTEGLYFLRINDTYTESFIKI